MLGYIFVLSVIFIGGIVSEEVNSSKRNKKLFLFLVFSILILFAVLRDYSVGIDYINRVKQMEYLFKLDFSELLQYTSEVQDGEYLYTIYIWLISRIIPSPWLINIIMDIFILSTFAWFFYKYSKDVTIATLMFVAFAFAGVLNTTRQYVAVSFFLIALDLLLKNKPGKALIPLIIATFIHQSAIVLFFIYLLYFVGFNLTRRKMIVLLTAVVAFFFLFDTLIEIFISYFPSYYYAQYSWAMGEVEFSFLWLIIYVTLFVLSYNTIPKKSLVSKDAWENENGITGLIIICYMLYATIGLLQSKMWFVSRMQMYFSFGYYMIVPEFFYRAKTDRKSKKILELLFMAGMTVWAFLMFKQDGHGILPYEFIF